MNGNSIFSQKYPMNTSINYKANWIDLVKAKH